MKKIPSLYRKAFSLLARHLLYTEAPSGGFSFNVAKISKEIQRQFILLHHKSQETFLDKFSPGGEFVLSIKDPDGTVREILRTEAVPEERIVYSLKENFSRSMSDYDFAKWLGGLINKSDKQYLHWGFTPKLSYSKLEQKIKPNCFGSAILLGSHFKERGIRVDMGITPDHPVIVLYLKGGVYLTDISGGLIKLKGKFKKYQGYKVYYPIEEDLKNHRMIMLFSFDDAVVYEILENTEALRRISLNEHRSTLPTSYIESIELGQKNKATLQLADWKNLQKILFPQIHKAFTFHHEKWLQEVERIREMRGNHYGQQIWYEISKEAIKATSYFDEDYQKGQLALLKESSPYSSDILRFLFMDSSFVFPEGVPNNTISFFSVVRTELISRKSSDQYSYEAVSIIMKLLENMVCGKFTKEEIVDITN